MKKGNIIQGKNLIEFFKEIKGYTLWSGNKEITDLAVIDLLKWYYISRWGAELYIIEMDFIESPDNLKDHLLR
jgi:hypothetical protein